MKIKTNEPSDEDGSVFFVGTKKSLRQTLSGETLTTCYFKKGL